MKLALEVMAKVKLNLGEDFVKWSVELGKVLDDLPEGFAIGTRFDTGIVVKGMHWVSIKCEFKARLLEVMLLLLLKFLALVWCGDGSGVNALVYLVVDAAKREFRWNKWWGGPELKDWEVS